MRSTKTKILPNMELALLFRKKRERLGLSREAFAHRLDITAAYLAHLERGGRPVHISFPLGQKLKQLLKIHDAKYWHVVAAVNEQVRKYNKRFR